MVSVAVGALLVSTPHVTQALEAEPTEVSFAFINDFHGRIDENTVQWAGTIERIREEAGYDNTLLVSAGDNFGNSLYASSVQGERPTVEVLDALELDASAVGNGDLFIGYDRYQELAAEARFPFLAANMVDGISEELAAEPYVIRDAGGVRVAIIGAITPDAKAQFPDGGLRFLPTVEALNRSAEEIEVQNLADVTVAVIHDGGGLNSPPASLEDELTQGGVLARIITEASPLIDALFTGHTHNQYVYEAPVPGEMTRTRPVIQTGSFGQRVGKVTLTLDRASGTVTSSAAALVPRSSASDADLVATYPRVAEVQRIVEDAREYALVEGNRPAGRASAPITTAFRGGEYVDGFYEGGDSGNRTLESALGTLVANMFRDVQQDQARPPEFGVTIPNFIRSDLIPDADGNVPIMQIIETFGIQDSIVSADVTGAQLYRLFEQQWQRTPEGDAKGYIQMAMSDNLAYTYDAQRPEGDRITSITVDGEQVSREQSYRVGLSGAILIGIVNFHEGMNLVNVTDSGLIDVDGFGQYFAALSQKAPVEPDFARRGVTVSETSESAGLYRAIGAEEVRDGELPTVNAGEQIELDLADLNQTSRGAPENTRLRVTVNGEPVQEVAIEDGAAAVRFGVPDTLAGQTAVLEMEAVPSGTIVTRGFRVAEVDAGGGTTDGAAGGKEGGGNDEDETPKTGRHRPVPDPTEAGISEQRELAATGGSGSEAWALLGLTLVALSGMLLRRGQRSG
ncbi:5'-nucleotidase [Leucobacter sp. 7(1)]|nr:5'-nucleotidase [Leucobacter sp. 7(1)]